MHCCPCCHLHPKLVWHASPQAYAGGILRFPTEFHEVNLPPANIEAPGGAGDPNASSNSPVVSSRVGHGMGHTVNMAGRVSPHSLDQSKPHTRRSCVRARPRSANAMIEHPIITLVSPTFDFSLLISDRLYE